MFLQIVNSVFERKFKQTNIYKATQLTREPIWERHLPGSLLWKGFISVGVIAGGNISKCLAQLSSTSLAT